MQCSPNKRCRCGEQKEKKTSIKRKRKPKKYQKTKIKFVSIVSLLSFAASLFHTKNKKKRQTHTYHVKRFVRSQWSRTKHTKSPPHKHSHPHKRQFHFAACRVHSTPPKPPFFEPILYLVPMALQTCVRPPLILCAERGLVVFFFF